MNKEIDIDKIAIDKSVCGYLWMSNSEEPVVFHNPDVLKDFLKSIDDVTNPFIVEGQLYFEEEKKSYSIRYTDSRHHIVEYNLDKVPAEWKSDEKKELIAHGRLKVSKLIFKQFWKPEKDSLCEGMEVLVPGAFVFVGFKNNNQEDKI